MPTPGFPDWFGPGAVVRERFTGERYVNGRRLVVMGVEMHPLDTTDPRPRGSYAISLRLLEERRDQITRMMFSVDDELIIADLEDFADRYEWTGDYFMADRSLVSTGTTMPVTMYTSAIQPMQRLIIQGTSDLNGEYVITNVRRGLGTRDPGEDALVISLNRPDATRLPSAIRGPLTDFLRMAPDAIRADLVDELVHSQLIDPLPVSREDMEDEPDDAYWDENPARAMNQVLVTDPPYGATLPSPGGHFVLSVDAGGVSQWVPVQPAVEGDLPIVEADQVWLLPQPNQGLWRTSWPTSGPANAMLRLTHTREASRLMHAAPTWLVEHGVRQQPPDPRQSRPGQVAYGQVWELQTTRTSGLSRYRVMEIDERAGRARLHREDGSGKRIYMRPEEILRNGTYVGDGLPRRTAFERVLEDDDDGERT